MNAKDFESVLEARIKNMRDVLGRKALEYSSTNNRLYNFQRAAEIADTTQRQALYGMLLKHLVCVHDLCTGKLVNTEEIVNEKIGDTINYLVLLEAVLEEEREAEEK